MKPKKKIKAGGREFSLNPNDYPWDEHCMVVCPGRWIYGLVTMPVIQSTNMRKADFTGMLWRYDGAGPAHDWIFTGRFRFYAGPNNDPWDDQDRKKWIVQKWPGLEVAAARAHADHHLAKGAVILLASGALPMPPEWFLIEGGCEVYFERMKTPPHWMHARSYSAPGESHQRVETRGWQPPSQ